MFGSVGAHLALGYTMNETGFEGDAAVRRGAPCPRGRSVVHTGGKVLSTWSPVQRNPWGRGMMVKLVDRPVGGGGTASYRPPEAVARVSPHAGDVS